MKMRAPANCGGTSLYTVTANGEVDVRDEHIETMRSHGFISVVDVDEDIPIEKMTHAQMVSYVLGETKKTIDSMSEKELRDHLISRQTVDEPLPAEHEARGASLPEVVTADDIDNFNRPQLYGYLKAKHVAVPPGDTSTISTGHLRELAHAALALDAGKTAAAAA